MTAEGLGAENRESVVAPASALQGGSSNEAVTVQEGRYQHQSQGNTEERGLQPQSLIPQNTQYPAALSQCPTPVQVLASLEAPEFPSATTPLSPHESLFVEPENDAGAGADAPRHDGADLGSDKVGRYDYARTSGGNGDDDDFEPSLSSLLSSTQQPGTPSDNPDESGLGA